MEIAHVAYTREEIRARVAELAAELRADFGDERPLLISLLKGSVIFLADLVAALGVDVDIDFMSITSYAHGRPGSGVVRIVKDLEEPIEGRRAIVIEDLVDTGLTLSYLLKTLETRSPKSLKVCALVDKDVQRIADPHIDFVGFRTSDFLVGYGLDFQGRYRNLPYLVAVTDLAALASRPDSLISLFQTEEAEADI